MRLRERKGIHVAILPVRLIHTFITFLTLSLDLGIPLSPHPCMKSILSIQKRHSRANEE